MATASINLPKGFVLDEQYREQAAIPGPSVQRGMPAGFVIEPAAETPSPSFDPEGSGYDDASAAQYGLAADETGHWPSRVPQTGLLLKGRSHPTFHKTIAGEEEAGYEIYKGEGGRYYSRKKSPTEPQRKWWEGGSAGDPAVLRTSKFIPGAAKQLLAADVDKWTGPDWESSIPDEKDWYYGDKEKAANIARLDLSRRRTRQGLPKTLTPEQRAKLAEQGLTPIEPGGTAYLHHGITPEGEGYIRSGAKPIGAKENIMRGDVLTKLPFSPVKAAEMLDVFGSLKRLEAEDFSKYTEAGIDAEKGKLRDQRVVDEYFKALQEQSVRGKTFMADVGSGVADLPAWMVEFWVTGGLAKLASKGVAKAGLKFMGKYVKTQAGRHALANALRAGAATVVTPTLRTLQQPHRVVEGAVDNMIQGDQPITAWLKAGVSQNIENWSEAMGGYITKGLRTSFATKDVMRAFDDIAKARYIAQGGTAEAFGKAIKAGGYDGLIGELGEEWLGGMSQALLGTETFGAEQTGDFLKDTQARLDAAVIALGKQTPSMAVTLAIPGAAKGGLDIAGRARQEPPAEPPPQPSPAQPVQPQAAEPPAEVVREGVEPTKAQRQHKTAVEQLWKKGKPVAERYREMYPDLVEKYEPVQPPTAEPEGAVEKLKDQGKLGFFEEDLFLETSKEEIAGIVSEVRKNEGDEAADITKSLLDKGIQTESSHIKEDEIIVRVSNLSDENKAILQETEGVEVKQFPRIQGDYVYFKKPTQPPVAKPKEKEIKHEQEAVIEPAPSPEVEQRKAGEPVPEATGKLDPTDPKDALEITKLHTDWVAGATKWRPRNVWEGVHQKVWNAKEVKYEPGEEEYTPEQVDAAYRLVQKPIESPMPDVNLFAMPGKEAELQAIAQKMSRMKPQKKKKAKAKVARPRVLPKAKTKKEDHIKAVYAASSKEEHKRYGFTGVYVEGDNLVATDGRRMFMAKDKWGKDGLYLNAAALGKGMLGKADKKGLKFPKWQDLVPSVSKRDAIIVDDLEKMWRQVRQASLMANEESPGLVVLVNKDGSLGFATASPEVGHSEVNVWPGAKIVSGFNPQYLIDLIAFHAQRGDTAIEFYFPQEADRPTLTRSPDGKTSTVIMPVGLHEPSKALKEAISERPAPKKKPAKPAVGKGVIGTVSKGRIKVSLEPGGRVQTAAEIVHYVERAFNIPLRGKATHATKKALGWFDPKAVGIRLKNVRSLTTAMHEIGHHIDWTLNKRMSLKPPKGTADELMALGRALYGSRKPPGGYKSEGWAEFIRMHLTGDDTKAAAPNLHEWFHKTYLPGHRDIAKKLAKTQGMITKWRMQGAEARIESQINRRTIKGTIAERLQRGILWFETKWIDKFAPIRKAVQATGEELRWDLDPFQIATARTSKAGAIARQMILEYTTDTAGNYTGPGLREVIKPVRKDIKAFTRYMMAARGRNLWKRGINPGFSQADADFVFERHDSPEWQEAAQAVTDWNHRILDYLVEAGGLESAVAKRMKELNPVYIPFLRAFKVGEINKPSGAGKGFTTTGKGVKAIKGSGRQSIEMLEAMIQQTAKLIGVAHKTEVAKALAGLADKKGMAAWIWKVPAPKQATQFEAEQLKKQITQIAVERLGLDPAHIPFDTETWDDVLTVFTNAGQFFGKENIVAIVIDGKKQFYEVHPQLYRAIAGLDKYNLPPIMDMLFGRATRMVRLGATGLNAAFGLIRNPIRDALTFTVLSKHAKLGPISAATGIAKDVINTETARRFKALGGKMSGQILFDRRATQHLRGELLATSIAGRTVYHATHPINALRELFGITEAGTRIGEFGPALKAAEKKYGKGSKAAAIEALNAAQDVTTNFTRNGEYARVLNQIIPFFNAGIQGPSKILRTFRARPIETTIKALIALTLPALWLWWKNRDKEWYKNLPLYEKTSYLHIEVPGEDKIIRLPVPFELGHIFQSIPIAILDAQYQDDPASMKGTMVEVMEQANPGMIPALFGPIVDVIWNRNFAGIPIVSRSMEGKLPEDRVKTHTTALMREIGKVLKVSPAQLEHLVDSYSGGIYKRTARMTETKGDSPSDIPVIGTLFTRDPFAPKAQVERFYDRSDLLDQKNQSGKITPAENIERLRLGRIRRKLSPLWKNLRTATTTKQRKQIWAKIGAEIEKAK